MSKMINKTFPIIYQNESYMVDPTYLANSSLKFQELIKNNQQNLQKLQLRITYEQFTKRDLHNFLKICHNEQTDVQNSELEQICLIAKMFQADQIYSTGLGFIQSNIDPYYIIPDNDLEEKNSQYLILEPTEESMLVHHANLNELEFDDSCERFETENDDNKVNNIMTTTTNTNNEDQTTLPKKKVHSVYYEITSDNPLLKCTRYYLKKDNTILYMAKVKNDEIYIGPGTNFHISENKIENTGRIKRDFQGYNIVNTDDQEFKIRYIRAVEKYSLNVSFVNNGSKLSWRPKEAKKATSFNGEFNHQPMQSKRNIILQNQKNHPTMIIRKMSKKTFEAECHPAVKPMIVFAIALSQILGPMVL